MIEELKRHKARQNQLKMRCRDTYHDEDFVFTKENKHPGYPEILKTIGNRMMRLLSFAKLPTTLTPHSLRHTHVSLLAEAGVSLPEIMERLGHKNDMVTREIYLHVTKTLKKEAAQKFDKLMDGL